MGPLQKDFNIHAKERDRAIALYIHIPFCLKKCPYCGFNSYRVDVLPLPQYSSCLIKEFSVVCKGLSNPKGFSALSSMYIGGGTPSLFSPGCFSKLLSQINEHLPFDDDIEITIEANPNTISLDKLNGYRKAGINRLSLGVQSLSPALLKVLGREHNAEDALRAFKDAREVGFENINIDLMFGVPGQTVNDLEETLLRTMELCPEHISIYSLTLERGTGFFELYAAAPMRSPLLPTEEVEGEMYLRAMELLTMNGYGHYEVSNFSRPGFECRHNMAYWQGRDYLGIGAGAHSYLKDHGWGRRWWNEALPDVYMQRVLTTASGALAGEEFLTKEMAMTEAILTGLRLIKGMDRRLFMSRFGVYPEEALTRKWLIEDGLLSCDELTMRLTQKGLLFLNEVF
ncbi:MAG: radical SAM family heme chaperone HemW [Deltaproteobacteria bacterium]|nr:radical SAM family heme chaperone HemW [Deltaproteobacteria bacterium]